MNFIIDLISGDHLIGITILFPYRSQTRRQHGNLALLKDLLKEKRRYINIDLDFFNIELLRERAEIRFQRSR